MTDGSTLLTRLLDALKAWAPGARNAVIGASAPDGMLLGSQKNIALTAERKLDAVCGGDTAVSAGKNVFIRALKGISLFAHSLGMKLAAAKGNVLVQAHNGDINLVATGRIRIIAGLGLELMAPEIKLASKGAQTDYCGGAITHQSKGDFIIKSSNFKHTTGGNSDVESFKFPSTAVETDERVILFHEQTGAPVDGRRYRLTLPDGRIVEGTTDEQGRTQLVTGQEVGEIEVLIYPQDQ